MGILDMLFGSGKKTKTTSPNFGPFEPLAQDLSQLSQFLINRPNVPYMGPQIAAPSPAYQAGMGRMFEIGMRPTERIDSPMRAPAQRAANGGALGQFAMNQRLAPGFNGMTGGNMPFRPPMAGTGPSMAAPNRPPMAPQPMPMPSGTMGGYMPFPDFAPNPNWRPEFDPAAPFSPPPSLPMGPMGPRSPAMPMFPNGTDSNPQWRPRREYDESTGDMLRRARQMYRQRMTGE